MALNRAVAVSMAQGPAPALALVEALSAGGDLDGYASLHTARADFLRRLARPSEAADAYRRAASLTQNVAERRFLEARAAECGAAAR